MDPDTDTLNSDPSPESGAQDNFSPADNETPPPVQRQPRPEGEKAPDFTFLDPRKREKKEAEAGPDTKKEEKPAGEAPAKPEKPPKEAAKPAKEAAKPKEQPAAEEKPAEKAAEKAAEKPKILTDEEIDALQPKPGASTAIHKDYRDMRAQIKVHAKVARELEQAHASAIKEIEGLKANTGKVPPEIEEKLKAAEQFQLLFDAQNNPTFRQQYDAKIESASSAIYDYLKLRQAPDEVIAEIKAAADANGGNVEAWKALPALIAHFDDIKDPIGKQEFMDLLKNRRDAVKSRNDRLSQLQGDRQGYFKELESRDKAEKDKWAKDLEAEAMRVGKGFEPAIEKEYPEGASSEVKAAIDRHNARVGEIAKSFQAKVIAAYGRDPKAIAQMGFDAVRADELDRQLKEAQSELEKERRRADEAEGKLSKVKAAGRVAHVESPSDAGRKPEEVHVGGDGRAAFDSFFKRK